jgi:SAM-dependent MidA family methyltransferase
MNEDPYQHVGEQDITAHVNFSSVKKWGEEAGLKTIGFCPQGTYLVSLGIDEMIMELSGGKPEFFDTAKIKGLILPEGMGESHKVMIQYKGEGNPVLRGFSLRNQVRKL